MQSSILLAAASVVTLGHSYPFLVEYRFVPPHDFGLNKEGPLDISHIRLTIEKVRWDVKSKIAGFPINMVLLQISCRITDR